MTHIYDPKKFAEYIKVAGHAMEACCQRFSLGGLNRVDVRASVNSSEYTQQYLMFLAARDKYEQSSPNIDNLVRIIFMNKQLKGAFCGEFAIYATLFIMENFPGTPVSALCFDNHQVCLIGQPKDFDPENIATWKDTVILDAWAGIIYLARDLEAQRKKGTKNSFLCS